MGGWNGGYLSLEFHRSCGFHKRIPNNFLMFLIFSLQISAYFAAVFNQKVWSETRCIMVQVQYCKAHHIFPRASNGVLPKTTTRVTTTRPSSLLVSVSLRVESDGTMLA